MEKDDKGSTLIRIGVSGWKFLLVPAYPGCPGSKAVKRSLYERTEHIWGFCKNVLQNSAVIICTRYRMLVLTLSRLVYYWSDQFSMRGMWGPFPLQSDGGSRKDNCFEFSLVCWLDNGSSIQHVKCLHSYIALFILKDSLWEQAEEKSGLCGLLRFFWKMVSVCVILSVFGPHLLPSLGNQCLDFAR